MKDTPSTQRINTAYLGVNEFLTPPAKWLQRKLKAYTGEAAERSIGYRVLRNLDQLWWPAEVLARMAYAEHRHAVVLYDRFPFRESREGHRAATPWGRVMAAYQDLAMRPVRMPDLVIFLDGDPHTIWSRKKEYPFETYLKVRQEYVDLLGKLPCETYTIRSDQGIEATFAQVKDVLERSPAIQRKLYLDA